MPFTMLEQVMSPTKFAIVLKNELAAATEKPTRFRLYEKFKDNEGVRPLLVVGKLPSAVSAGIRKNGGKLLAAGACQKVKADIHFTIELGTTTPQKFKDAGKGGVARAILVDTLDGAEADEELQVELETQDLTPPPEAVTAEPQDPKATPSSWKDASPTSAPGGDLKRLQVSLARSEAQSLGVLESVRQMQDQAVDLQSQYLNAQHKPNGEGRARMTELLPRLEQLANKLDTAVKVLTLLAKTVHQLDSADPQVRQAVDTVYGPLMARLLKADAVAKVVRNTHAAMQQAHRDGQPFDGRATKIKNYEPDAWESPVLQRALLKELSNATGQLQAAQNTLLALVPECQAIYGKVIANEPVTANDLQAIGSIQQAAAQASKPFSGLNSSVIKKWRELDSAIKSANGIETPEVLSLQQKVETAYNTYNAAFGAADDIVKDLDYLIGLIKTGNATQPATDKGMANQALDALLLELQTTEEKLVGEFGPITLFTDFAANDVPGIKDATQQKLSALQVPPSPTDLQDLQRLLLDCQALLDRVKANQPVLKRAQQGLLFHQKNIVRRVGQQKVDKQKLLAVVTKIKALQKHLDDSSRQGEELANALRQTEAKLKLPVS